MARRCEVCRRSIRADSQRAVFLFWRPNDVRAEVCSQRCLVRYNDGEDVNPGGAMSESVTYQVGDHLPDGREVQEVDDKGRPLVVGPKPKAATAPAGGSVEVPAHDTSIAEAVADATGGGTHRADEPAPKPRRKASAPKPEAKTQKASKPSKKTLNTSAIAEKVAAAKAVESEPHDATMTKEEPVASKKKAKKAKASPKAKAKANGRKTTKWTEELKAKLRAQIKAETTTYAKIAKEMGITAQTVWASLNRKKK